MMKDDDRFKELISDDMTRADLQLLGNAIMSDWWFRFKQRLCFWRKK